MKMDESKLQNSKENGFSKSRRIDFQSIFIYLLLVSPHNKTSVIKFPV